ncbi:MAG: DUF3482 domain-containing protein [Xanthomonadales bacterium]|nr:DUF3482 domain-containing protein [Xanthomonadales bacterium]
MSLIPRFAVVGHPNKGKSSIVATLALDDSVSVARSSGTTRHSQSFPMKVDGRILYELIDTPGFQRARKTLAWMQNEAEKVHDRPEVVRRFVDHWQGTDQFIDECELLKPIINGAGIIYVVDGSRPYGTEYEAEMEILRWSGQPSMALINPIGSDEYVEEWRAALNQYFRITRVFNAMTVEFQKRIEILNAFGQLQESWRQPLQQAVGCLAEMRKNQHQQAAAEIAKMVTKMCAFKLEKKISTEAEPMKYQSALASKFFNKLRKLEAKCRRQVQALYQHTHLHSQEDAIELLDSDLFKLKDWYLWGLSKIQLSAISAAAGATAGLAVDAAVGGASLMLGAISGGILGGAGSWFMADKIARKKISGVLPLGGKILTFGPVTNRNFPYVLLGRALYHQRLVAGRPHAQRDALSLKQQNQNDWLNELNQQQRKQLDKLCKCLSQAEKPDETRENLVLWLQKTISFSEINRP